MVAKVVDDERIVKFLMDRNEEGLKLLDEFYTSFLTYTVSSILKYSNEDIEECLSDVYVKIWSGIDGFDNTKASLKTYLARMARNHAIDMLRRKSKEQRLSINNCEDLTQEYPDPSLNVEEQLLKKEELDFLNRNIRKLKQKERELFIRRYFYDQPSRQIGYEMGFSVSAVDNKLSRIRKKIKGWIKEENYYE
jgi:RNA polymerase sigma-70 factor (ECF subfamily)